MFYFQMKSTCNMAKSNNIKLVVSSSNTLGLRLVFRVYGYNLGLILRWKCYGLGLGSCLVKGYGLRLVSKVRISFRISV